MQPAGRRSVGKCLQFLLIQLGKPAPKDTGSTEWGCRWKDERGRTLKSSLKLFSSSPSSAATRDEKTEETEKQQSLINCLEQPQRKASLAPQAASVSTSSQELILLPHTPSTPTYPLPGCFSSCPMRNASIMENLSNSRLNQQQS